MYPSKVQANQNGLKLNGKQQFLLCGDDFISQGEKNTLQRTNKP